MSALESSRILQKPAYACGRERRGVEDAARGRWPGIWRAGPVFTRGARVGDARRAVRLWHAKGKRASMARQRQTAASGCQRTTGTRCRPRLPPERRRAPRHVSHSGAADQGRGHQYTRPPPHTLKEARRLRRWSIPERFGVPITTELRVGPAGLERTEMRQNTEVVGDWERAAQGIIPHRWKAPGSMSRSRTAAPTAAWNGRMVSRRECSQPPGTTRPWGHRAVSRSGRITEPSGETPRDARERVNKRAPIQPRAEVRREFPRTACPPAATRRAAETAGTASAERTAEDKRRAATPDAVVQAGIASCSGRPNDSGAPASNFPA